MAYETRICYRHQKVDTVDTSQQMKQHMILHLIIIKAAEGFISICHAQIIANYLPILQGQVEMLLKHASDTRIQPYR